MLLRVMVFKGGREGGGEGEGDAACFCWDDAAADERGVVMVEVEEVVVIATGELSSLLLDAAASLMSSLSCLAPLAPVASTFFPLLAVAPPSSTALTMSCSLAPARAEAKAMSATLTPPPPDIDIVTPRGLMIQRIRFSRRKVWWKALCACEECVREGKGFAGCFFFRFLKTKFAEEFKNSKNCAPRVQVLPPGGASGIRAPLVGFFLELLLGRRKDRHLSTSPCARALIHKTAEAKCKHFNAILVQGFKELMFLISKR